MLTILDECYETVYHAVREVEHGRRQKRDIVKEGKILRDIVNASFQNA